MSCLQIITHQFELSEIDDLSCIEPYDIMNQELELKHLSDFDRNQPVLYIIRLLRGEVVPDDFWKQVSQTHRRNRLSACLLIMQEKNFEILYQAMGAHVNEVVVEPAEQRELQSKINNCVQTIFNLQKIRDNQKQLAEYEFNKRQKVMQKIMDGLMEKPEEVTFLLPEINKRYGINLGEKNYQVLVISVDQFELCSKNPNFVRELSLQILYHIDCAQEVIISYIEPYGHIAVLNFSDTGNREQLTKALFELKDAIIKMQENYGAFHFSIGVGSWVEKLSDTKKSLSDACLVQDYRMQEPNGIFFAQDYPNMRKRLQRMISDRNIQELLRYVSLGDQNLIREWFERYFKTKDPLFKEFPPAYTQVARSLCEYAREMENSNKNVHFPFLKYYSLQHVFDGTERMRQTEILLMEVCHMMQSELSVENELALHAIAYMKVHFAEPISLEVLADNCGFSTSYFSRKFKEQTGENYIDVLSEIRIKEAERLLIETDDSIEQIIEKTGYCDDKHFRKLFVKYTGMNPSEYRKSEKGKLGR